VRKCTTLLFIVAMISPLCAAHESAGDRAMPWWTLWSFEPGVVIPLIAILVFYVRGLLRFWQNAGIGHGITRSDAIWFAIGWLTLVIALISPIHTIGQFLFSVHMTQHELLMLIAAPTLILGRPLIAMLAGLPPGVSLKFARWSRQRAWQKTWHFFYNPLTAWSIHAAALWLWHIPVLFNAALESEFVHALQHIFFLASALLFWWALMGVRYSYIGYGAAVLYVFTTALHSGLLGAFLSVSTTLFYRTYADTAPLWGFAPIEDQQLGGLIMWIPAGFVYVFAGLALFAGWLRHSERHAWFPPAGE
jgi:putative membrane protein